MESLPAAGHRVPGILLAVGLAFAAALACERPSGDAGMQSLEPDRVLEMVEAPHGPLLLDVRTVAEFQRGHVPGARNIPHDELAKRLDEIASYRERGVVAYCRSGRRARIALDILSEAGFANLAHLAGDLARWRDDGRPIERPGPP